MTGLDRFLSELPSLTREQIIAHARARKKSVREFIIASLIEHAELGEREISADGAVLQNRLLRVPEAAAFVGLSVSMLNKMRVAGTGPRYVKLAAKAVGYWRGDLVDWLNSRVCYSTSEGANLK